MSHVAISPAILYWGTPVVLITSANEADAEESCPSFNIAPMSSAWWLGDRCILGLASTSQTTQNILRTKQCVLNLPAYTPAMVEAVNNLARTTGTREVPAPKVSMGYRYVKDKFCVAGLTPMQSESVTPPRIQECAVQMEAEMMGYHRMLEDRGDHMKGFMLAIEMKVVKIYVDQKIRMAMPGKENRVDPDKWRPMFMSFQQLYGMGRRGDFETGSEGEVDKANARSKLAEINEEVYRLPPEVET